METPEKSIIQNGGHNSNDNQIELKAGHLSMIYENGSLRHISSDGHELLRMIYMAVRDREWITVNPRISGEEFNVFSDSFSISYVAYYCYGNIMFFAKFRITGYSDSSLVFRFDGKALRDFEKNRIGFCVLHPVNETAGSDCMIENPENEISLVRFPDLISPHQPFTNISSMQWNVSRINCRIEFSGDVFETEDQRNWTDASFKTYSTPLSIPFPARIQKGEHVNQKVIFRIKGGNPRSKKDSRNLITIDQTKVIPLPLTGVGRSTRKQPVTEAELNVIKSIGFDHYRTDLYLFDPGWNKVAEIASSEASLLGLELECALFFNENHELQIREFTSWARSTGARISTVIILHQSARGTPDQLTDIIAPILKEALTGISIVAGTNCNFAQVNRNRPVSEYIDGICYAIHPQEHAGDNLTLVENLEAQKHTIDTARSFAGNKGIWISPVNIQRRFNANTSIYELPSKSDVCPPQVDSRMMSLFGAAWTAISMKYIFEGGAKGVTFHETVGERGLMQGEYPSRWPKEFPASKGMLFPVFHVFSSVLKSKAWRVLASKSSHPLLFDSLVLSDGENMKIILVNFTSPNRGVFLEGVGNNLLLKQLNTENFREAASDPLWLSKAKVKKHVREEKIILAPYSISFIESTV